MEDVVERGSGNAIIAEPMQHTLDPRIKHTEQQGGVTGAGETEPAGLDVIGFDGPDHARGDGVKALAVQGEADDGDADVLLVAGEGVVDLARVVDGQQALAGLPVDLVHGLGVFPQSSAGGRTVFFLPTMPPLLSMVMILDGIVAGSGTCPVLCLLVVIGVCADGRKELVALADD